MNKALHTPVMLQEAIEQLHVQPDAWYIDATFGRGGHTQKLLKKKANVIALDVDQEAIDYGKEKFKKEIEQEKLVLINKNFSDLEQGLRTLNNAPEIRGVLYDFGTSLDQLRSPVRGFGFENEQSPLDMRMDQNLGVTASDLLTILSVKQLAELFREYGGEIHAKKIAIAIDKYRGNDRENRIETVGELNEIVFKAVKKQRKSHLHPSTKIFQALRIAVNDELNSIKQSLPQALKALSPQGKVVTIAFHQGEDVIVKTLFKQWQQENLGKIVTEKPLTPSDQEIINNPAARSAKLRAFIKK